MGDPARGDMQPPLKDLRARGSDVGPLEDMAATAEECRNLGKSDDPAATADEVRKYDESEARDASGKWTSGGSSDPELTSVRMKPAQSMSREKQIGLISEADARLRALAAGYEGGTTASRASFSRGDRVEVNDPGTSYHGSSGSVASMGTGGMVRFVPHGELEDDAVDVHESKLVRKMAENQARDESGKWSSGGGGSIPERLAGAMARGEAARAPAQAKVKAELSDWNHQPHGSFKTAPDKSFVSVKVHDQGITVTHARTMKDPISGRMVSAGSNRKEFTHDEVNAAIARAKEDAEKLGKSFDSAATAEEVRKYSEDEARDDAGKWTAMEQASTQRASAYEAKRSEVTSKLPDWKHTENGAFKSGPNKEFVSVRVHDSGIKVVHQLTIIRDNGRPESVGARVKQFGLNEVDAAVAHAKEEAKTLTKGSPDQPRDAGGKWTQGEAEHIARSDKLIRGVHEARQVALRAAQEHGRLASELEQHLMRFEPGIQAHPAELASKVAAHGAEVERALEDLKFATEQRNMHFDRAPKLTEVEQWRGAGDVARMKATPKKFGKSMEAQVCKVDGNLGLVFGWAIVCCEDGQPYFDKQDDHVPEDAMLEAACDFMLNSRDAGEMHRRTGAGQAIFAWPMTKEIADSFGISTQRTGLMFAMKPDAAMLKRFQSGELTAFSIGGQRGLDEKVDD